MYQVCQQLQQKAGAIDDGDTIEMKWPINER